MSCAGRSELADRRCVRTQASLYADWVAWLPAEPEEGDARGGARGAQRGEPRARHAPLRSRLRAPLSDALPLIMWMAKQLTRGSLSVMPDSMLESVQA
jgi:hypothetical protein